MFMLKGEGSLLHSDWSVSYRSEVKARQDVKPDIRQPPFTDYRQPPVDYRHPPVADYRQPPTLDYRHPPLLDYRQLANDARQFTIPEYRMPPVQVRFPTQEKWLLSRLDLWSWYQSGYLREYFSVFYGPQFCCFGSFSLPLISVISSSTSVKTQQTQQQTTARSFSEN